MRRESLSVVVIGGGLAAVRTIEQLRSRGHSGPITLVCRETHLPYDRPPLSKQVLSGAWPPARTTLHDSTGWAELGVDLRMGTAAVAMEDHKIVLDDGTSLTGDALVLATGARARELPHQPNAVASLRTLDDALALRNALGSAQDLIIVGGGFIGAEVAHVATALGVEVTVLEALAVPCERILGPEVGRIAARLFSEGGVTLRCNAAFDSFDGSGAVVTTAGERLSANAVLVSVGSVPATNWLDGSGIPIDDGITSEACGRVQGTDGVWAVGDVAAWWDALRGRHFRSEHWTSAVDQAAIVACDILGLDKPPAEVPYVWSDQFGIKVQVLGRTDLADHVVPLHGEGLNGGAIKGTLIGYFAGSSLMAAVAFGAPGLLMRLRALIAEGADLAAVHAALPDAARV